MQIDRSLALPHGITRSLARDETKSNSVLFARGNRFWTAVEEEPGEYLPKQPKRQNGA